MGLLAWIVLASLRHSWENNRVPWWSLSIPPLFVAALTTLSLVTSRRPGMKWFDRVVLIVFSLLTSLGLALVYFQMAELRVFKDWNTWETFLPFWILIVVTALGPFLAGSVFYWGTWRMKRFFLRGTFLSICDVKESGIITSFVFCIFTTIPVTVTLVLSCLNAEGVFKERMGRSLSGWEILIPVFVVELFAGLCCIPLCIFHFSRIRRSQEQSHPL